MRWFFMLGLGLLLSFHAFTKEHDQQDVHLKIFLVDSAGTPRHQFANRANLEI